MQTNKRLSKLLSAFCVAALLAALALSLTACGQTEKSAPVSFTLQVVDGDGNQTDLKLQSDKPTLGDALLDLGIAEGDMGPYGLCITKVNGIYAEYAATGTYWALYVDGEYASAGVDSTPLTPDTVYALKVEQ